MTRQTRRMSALAGIMFGMGLIAAWHAGAQTGKAEKRFDAWWWMRRTSKWI